MRYFTSDTHYGHENTVRFCGRPYSDVHEMNAERAPPAPSQRKWVGYMPSAELRGVTLDCDDPQSLARFYQELTGMTVGFSRDGYVALTGGPGPALGFQRVENYRAPHWPDQQIPQQLHLDFAVEDLDAATDLVLALGATRPEHQPGGDRCRVLLDPAGHPFCLLAT